MMTRRVLGGLSAAVAVLVGVTFVGSSASAGPPAKVAVCHLDAESGTYKAISIPERAAQAHLRHGDGIPGGNVPGSEGAFEFDDDCGQVATIPTEFAVAYTNLDGTPGYDPTGDALLARLIDDDRDGVPSAGDKLLLDRYPLDIDGISLGTFGVTEYQVTGILSSSGFAITVNTSAGNVTFIDTAGAGLPTESEAFQSLGSTCFVQDGFTESFALDFTRWSTSCPGSPSQSVEEDFVQRSGDQPFLDVDLNL